MRAPRDFYVLNTGPRPLAFTDMFRFSDLIANGQVTQADVDAEMAARRADNERARKSIPSMWGGKTGNGYGDDR